LHINGSVRISNWTDIIIDCSGEGTGAGTPTIYPENNGWLQLGKPGKVLGNIYVTSSFFSDIYRILAFVIPHEKLKHFILFLLPQCQIIKTLCIL